MKIKTLALLGAASYGLYHLSQRTGVPAGVEPVRAFEPGRYLGRWYEIARIDFAQERGLSATSASYSRLPDGRIGVLNRGFDARARRYRQARAVAEPVDGADRAHLQVSFFWPVRASYIVFDLDEGYQHAVVSGPTHDYLWLLARSPRVKPTARARMLDAARSAGFDVDRLLWVDQRRNLGAE